MNNKNLMIGLGVLAVAGIGLYMWKRRKDGQKTEKKSDARGISTSKNTAFVPSLTSGRSIPASEVGNIKPTQGKEWCCSEYDTYNKCKTYTELPIGLGCNFNLA